MESILQWKECFYFSRHDVLFVDYEDPIQWSDFRMDLLSNIFVSEEI
jgi:hypothetical protein